MQELLHMNNAVGWDKIMNNDLTVGKSEKVLWRFCLPLFGSIIFQQLYNIADSLVAQVHRRKCACSRWQQL